MSSDMPYHLSALCVLAETSVDDFLLVYIATQEIPPDSSVDARAMLSPLCVFELSRLSC